MAGNRCILHKVELTLKASDHLYCVGLLGDIVGVACGDLLCVKVIAELGEGADAFLLVSFLVLVV